MKCPTSINNQLALLEDLLKKIPDAAPEIKTALRHCILEMAVAYKITPESRRIFVITKHMRNYLECKESYFWTLTWH